VEAQRQSERAGREDVGEGHPVQYRTQLDGLLANASLYFGLVVSIQSDRKDGRVERSKPEPDNLPNSISHGASYVRQAIMRLASNFFLRILRILRKGSAGKVQPVEKSLPRPYLDMS
jgi:hypothetical protein